MQAAAWLCIAGFGFQSDCNGELVAGAARGVMRDNCCDPCQRDRGRAARLHADGDVERDAVGSSVVITLDDGSSIGANLALFAADDLQFV
jgi:hypothetical protein